MSGIAILEAFEGIGDPRRKQGKRHSLPLCLALFTLAVAAGNQGFLAIGDWLDYHSAELKEVFRVERLPSYSTIRRVLLETNYQEYAERVAQFFKIQPREGETISLDGKTLRGSFHMDKDNESGDSHPAIVLVSAYLVERGLILEPYPVTQGSNEITALPEFIKALALSGVVFAFDAINTQKNDSNHCRNGESLFGGGEGESTHSLRDDSVPVCAN